MKHYKNLFEQITATENLILAFQKASKGKQHYTAVKEVNKNLLYHINLLQNMLKNKTYIIQPKDYKYELINDKGKERDLYKLNFFPHRIIQWAIINVLQDKIIKSLTKDTYASLPNRGIHKLKKNLEKALRDKENTKHCLKIDIKKFYPNIDNKILFSMLDKKFHRDKDLMWLLGVIIFSRGGKGQPIGSLTSQYFANFYLSEMTHYLKEKEHIKYMFLYMDDIVFLHKSKKYLHKLKLFLDKYLEDNLKLKIKENWQVFPVDIRGIDYVGYRFFRDYTILRKSIYKNAKKSFENNSKNKMSYYGWCKYANVGNFVSKYNLDKKSIEERKLINYKIKMMNKYNILLKNVSVKILDGLINEKGSYPFKSSLQLKAYIEFKTYLDDKYIYYVNKIIILSRF